LPADLYRKEPGNCSPGPNDVPPKGSGKGAAILIKGLGSWEGPFQLLGRGPRQGILGNRGVPIKDWGPPLGGEDDDQRKWTSETDLAESTRGRRSVKRSLPEETLGTERHY